MVSWFARLTAVATAALALHTTATAQTGGDAIINPDAQGTLIDVYYKDFKANNNPGLTASSAQNFFVTDGMNGIRTPIYGDLSHPAHPSAGTVVASWYTPHINAIRLAKAANPAVKVFASKKLDGQDSFPAWTKNASNVIASQYAIMLADYLQYMQAQGIVIDYLGVDNERQFNEGAIGPTRYKDIIDALRALAVSRGFTVPILVAPEDYGPNRNNWIAQLLANNWGDRMAIYGTHYYPDLRPVDKLEADLVQIGNRPFWFTEPHWPSVDGQDDLAVAEDAICALWDGTDRTMSGFMWWSYSRTGLRGNLMKAFSTPLIGSRPIDMDDIDGENISVPGRLQTRAFRKGNTITVYALNLSTTTAYANYGFNLSSGVVTSPVTYTQWVDGSPNTGNTGTAAKPLPNQFRLTLPTRSITAFSFTYALAPVIALPADQVLEATSAAGAVATYSATATSPNGAVTVTLNPASGTVFPLGTTNVTVTATDVVGAVATGTFKITVRDTTAPVLALPANLTAEATAASGATVSFSATATDLVSGSVPVGLTPASGSVFPLGTTTVNATAGDSSGNVANGSFTVAVQDTTPPVLTLPENQTLEATSSDGAVASFSASAFDAVSGGVPVAFSPASGSVFALGVNTVTATAADAAGNVASGTFTVTVRDTTAPVLMLPANLVVEATSSAGAVATFAASATDLVSGPVTVSFSPASGSVFPLGTTTVTATATDAAGNSVSGTFTVTVGDTTAPTITNLVASPNSIWPPNHKMVNVVVSAVVTDAVDAAATVRVLGVTCNQAISNPGSGNTSPDWVITGDRTLQVRAERDGNGGDRVYTILVEARDAAGNVANGTVTVTVPHNR